MQKLKCCDSLDELPPVWMISLIQLRFSPLALIASESWRRVTIRQMRNSICEEKTLAGTLGSLLLRGIKC